MREYVLLGLYGSFPKLRYPNLDPQYTIVPITGIPKRYPNFGKPPYRDRLLFPYSLLTISNASSNEGLAAFRKLEAVRGPNMIRMIGAVFWCPLLGLSNIIALQGFGHKLRHASMQCFLRQACGCLLGRSH